MADYSLQDFWWNKPSRTESQLPALQLGVQIVQRRAQQDLQERQLADELARTEIARAESMYKLQLQTSISAANAELAGLAAQITDFSDPAQMKPIYDLGSRAGYVVGTKGWEGIINTHERAVSAKIRAENTESLIASREDRAEYNAVRLELQALLADNTIDLTDERILKLQKETAMMDREMAVREGNLRLRGVELDQKGKRLSLRDTVAYKNELKALENEEKDATATVGDAEKLRLRKLYNLKRRSITEKFYGPHEEAAPEVKTPRTGLQTNEPPVVSPQPVSPGTNRVSVVSPDGKPGTIPESQLEEALKAGYKRP